MNKVIKNKKETQRKKYRIKKGEDKKQKQKQKVGEEWSGQVR